MQNISINNPPKFKCRHCQDTGIIGVDEIDTNTKKIKYEGKAFACDCLKGKETGLKCGLRCFREAISEPWHELSWQSRIAFGLE